MNLGLDNCRRVGEIGGTIGWLYVIYLSKPSYTCYVCSSIRLTKNLQNSFPIDGVYWNK